MRAVAFVALTVGLACGVFAVPAFGFVSRSTKKIVVPKFSTASASATCPAGEHASFGGVISEFRGPITASNLNSRMVFTTGMHRLGTNPRVLTVTADNPRASGAHYTAIAYCDRGVVPTAVSKTVRLGAFSDAAAVANCPAGTVAVGGGFASGSGTKNLEYLGVLALTSATRLFVDVANLSNVATKVTALVYCAPGAEPTPHEKAQSVGGHKLVTATISCPSGTKLLWGGLGTSPPSGSGSNVSAVIPLSWYAPTATQWRVTAYNLGTKAGTVYAEAYCR